MVVQGAHQTSSTNKSVNVALHQSCRFYPKMADNSVRGVTASGSYSRAKLIRKTAISTSADVEYKAS